jgi:hypothetical protein
MEKQKNALTDVWSEDLKKKENLEESGTLPRSYLNGCYKNWVVGCELLLSVTEYGPLAGCFANANELSLH